MADISSIRRNLISLPILDGLGCSFLFGSRKVKLYLDYLFIGNGKLCGGFYRLKLSMFPFVFATLTVNTIKNAKRLRLNEKSSILWHKPLGHISK